MKNSELTENDSILDSVFDESHKPRTELYDWLECIVVALVCSILVFVFVGRVIGVKGHSMNPTLFDADKIIMSNLFFEPKQGDIVVLTKKSFSEEPIVKRVIATEGQTVDINFNSGEVYVDGVLLNETYINDLTQTSKDMAFPLTVDKGCVFVMGDNRNRSLDSRDSRVGQVDRRCILGKVYMVILPFNRIGFVDHG